MPDPLRPALYRWALTLVQSPERAERAGPLARQRAWNILRQPRAARPRHQTPGDAA